MSTNLADPKQGEREYYRNIGDDGLRHALGKPFTDAKCGEYLADIAAIMSLFPPPPARGLDLGCGTGWTSSFLARRGYEIMGADISSEAIQAASERREQDGCARLQFLCADYEELSFHEEFDFALFYDSLHHAEDEQLAMQKAFNALKHGGCLLTFEPGTGHHLAEGSRQAVEKYHVHEKEMPPSKIIRLAQNAGFSQHLILPQPQVIHSILYGQEAASPPADGFGRLRQKLKFFYIFLRQILLPGEYGVVLLRK